MPNIPIGSPFISFIPVFDGDGNLVRSAVRQQVILRDGKSAIVGSVDTEDPEASYGVLTVSSDKFPSYEEIEIGPYTLRESRDFNGVDGSAGDTAVALAAAINRLPEFSAVVDATDITIYGPNGPNPTRFTYTRPQAVPNFTLSPSNGFFEYGDPIFRGPEFD